MTSIHCGRPTEGVGKKRKGVNKKGVGCFVQGFGVGRDGGIRLCLHGCSSNRIPLFSRKKKGKEENLKWVGEEIQGQERFAPGVGERGGGKGVKEGEKLHRLDGRQTHAHIHTQAHFPLSPDREKGEEKPRPKCASCDAPMHICSICASSSAEPPQQLALQKKNKRLHEHVSSSSHDHESWQFRLK